MSLRRSRLLLPLLALLGAAGCPRREAPARDGAVVLNLWHTFNPEETATLERILGRIRAQHPGWRLQVTVIPFARAQNELRRAAQRCGPGAPDVFRAEFPWLAELAERRLIRPVPASAPPESDYLPQARQVVRYQGERWALPASLDGLALLYHRSLLSRPPATVEELIDAGRRLTRDAGGRSPGAPGFDERRVVRWGFYVRSDAYWFLPFLWAGGGELFDPATGDVRITEAPAVAALTLYRDLIRVHHIAPPHPSSSSDFEDQNRRFAAGEVAMMINGPWVVSSLLGQGALRDPERLGIAPFPAGRGGAPAAPLSGHGYVVSRCAGRPDLAWALARALGGVEAQVDFARENSLLPTLGAAHQRAEVRGNRLVTEFSRALARARPRPQHPASARIFDDFTPAIQAVLLGDAPPEEALTGVVRAWRRLLRRPERAP